MALNNPSIKQCIDTSISLTFSESNDEQLQTKTNEVKQTELELTYKSVFFSSNKNTSHIEHSQLNRKNLFPNENKSTPKNLQKDFGTDASIKNTATTNEKTENKNENENQIISLYKLITNNSQNQPQQNNFISKLNYNETAFPKETSYMKRSKSTSIFDTKLNKKQIDAFIKNQQSSFKVSPIVNPNSLVNSNIFKHNKHSNTTQHTLNHYSISLLQKNKSLKCSSSHSNLHQDKHTINELVYNSTTTKNRPLSSLVKTKSLSCLLVSNRRNLKHSQCYFSYINKKLCTPSNLQCQQYDSRNLSLKHTYINSINNKENFIPYINGLVCHGGNKVVSLKNNIEHTKRVCTYNMKNVKKSINIKQGIGGVNNFTKYLKTSRGGQQMQKSKVSGLFIQNTDSMKKLYLKSKNEERENDVNNFNMLPAKTTRHQSKVRRM